MPLLRIDVIKGERSPSELRRLTDVVQQVLLDKFDAPARDRYQVSHHFSASRSRPRNCTSLVGHIADKDHKIISQHEPYELICEDSQLGYNRTNRLVIIQILQQGRDAAKKQRTFAALAKELKAQCNLKGEDLIISCTENAKEDWSFGEGEAQFLTGKL